MGSQLASHKIGGNILLGIKKLRTKKRYHGPAQWRSSNQLVYWVSKEQESAFGLALSDYSGDKTNLHIGINDLVSNLHVDICLAQNSTLL